MIDFLLPLWQCHKVVRAVKIRAVVYECTPEGRAAHLHPAENVGRDSFYVSSEFVKKHDPRPGGYFVVYEDGYRSFSPAKAFEEGYARIK